MKLSEWFKARSGQELMMIAVVAMPVTLVMSFDAPSIAGLSSAAEAVRAARQT